MVVVINDMNLLIDWIANPLLNDLFRLFEE